MLSSLLVEPFKLLVFEPDQLFVPPSLFPEPELLFPLLKEPAPLPLLSLFTPPELEEPFPVLLLLSALPELVEPLSVPPEVVPDELPPLPVELPPPMPPAPPVWATAHMDKLQRTARTAILVFIFFGCCVALSFQQCRCHRRNCKFSVSNSDYFKVFHGKKIFHIVRNTAICIF
jgi:hypothetical protein